ncbi:MAG: hypothetical protein GQ570_07135 [Helicobacteraceae bacterium]|nr:hypothetical protein [Helicobacteraceae bacterium]
MKLTKLSLATSLLMAVSASAIDNVKVDGNAKLYYYTDDKSNISLFDKKSSRAQSSINVGLSANLIDKITVGARVQALSMLGLENQLADQPWSGSTKDQWWMSDLWLASTIGNTTTKVGRQKLDTPLAFTEGWTTAYNTFEAAVLLNSDLPDTTLVGAFLGATNSSNDGWVTKDSSDGSSPFETYGNALLRQYLGDATALRGNGAYAAGVINKSLPDTALQAWYYDVNNIVTALWLQGDTTLAGITLGAMYADLDPTGQLSQFKNTTGYALQAKYNLSIVDLKAAYSNIDGDGTLSVKNTAGNGTKLYTEAWWWTGFVSTPGASSYNISATFKTEYAEILASYVSTNGAKKSTAGETDFKEIALVATKSYGALETSIAYINDTVTGADKENNGDSINSVQLYLTLNF